MDQKTIVIPSYIVLDNTNGLSSIVDCRNNNTIVMDNENNLHINNIIPSIVYVEHVFCRGSVCPDCAVRDACMWRGTRCVTTYTNRTCALRRSVCTSTRLVAPSVTVQMACIRAQVGTATSCTTLPTAIRGQFCSSMRPPSELHLL